MTVRLKPDTTAIDIAILPPADVSARAIALSAALPADQSQGLLLGADCLPHITLTQQFIPSESLDQFLAQVEYVLQDRQPIRVQVTGGGKASNAVWLSIERSPQLVNLHEDLLQAAEPFEVTTGDATAFFGEDAREPDVR